MFPCSGVRNWYLIVNEQTSMHVMQSTAMAELIVSHKAGERLHLKENKIKIRPSLHFKPTSILKL